MLESAHEESKRIGAEEVVEWMRSGREDMAIRELQRSQQNLEGSNGQEVEVSCEVL